MAPASRLLSSGRLLAVALVLLVVTACGSTTVAVRVGSSTLDRDTVATLVSEVTGRPAGESLDAVVAAGVVDRYVRYEALVDLLAENGVVVTDDDRAAARDRLLAAGIDPGDPTLPRISRWQAALDLVEVGVPGVQASYDDNAALLGHDLCTSHILVSEEDDAHAVLHLLAQGEDFAILAGNVSQDPGSGQNGGALGCVPLGASFRPSNVPPSGR